MLDHNVQNTILFRNPSFPVLPLCCPFVLGAPRLIQIRAALDYVVGEHVGGARSSEKETRLIDTVAQALVGEEELAHPTKVNSFPHRHGINE